MSDNDYEPLRLKRIDSLLGLSTIKEDVRLASRRHWSFYKEQDVRIRMAVHYIVRLAFHPCYTNGRSASVLCPGAILTATPGTAYWEDQDSWQPNELIIAHSGKKLMVLHTCSSYGLDEVTWGPYSDDQLGNLWIFDGTIGAETETIELMLAGGMEAIVLQGDTLDQLLRQENFPAFMGTSLLTRETSGGFVIAPVVDIASLLE